jgi:hypothetical protein
MGYDDGTGKGYYFGEQFGTGNRVYAAGTKTVLPGTVWPLNSPILSVVTYDGSTVEGWCNGVSDGTTGGGSAAAYGSFARLFCGNNPDGHGFNGAIYYFGLVAGVLSRAAIRALTNDPYRVFATATPDKLWIVPAGGTTSAGIAVTDAPDVAAITTTVTTGSAVAATDAVDVAAITDAIWTTSQIGATDAPDVAVITTTVTTGGSIAGTDAPDTASITADAGVPTTPTVTPDVGGGGKRHRRDRIIVVAWGEEYEVETHEQALALFKQLKAQAAVKAPVAAEKAVRTAAKSAPITAPIIEPPRITLRGPLAEIEDDIAEFQANIAETYQQAAAASYAAYLAMMEDDDDDAIMALLS